MFEVLPGSILNNVIFSILLSVSLTVLVWTVQGNFIITWSTLLQLAQFQNVFMRDIQRYLPSKFHNFRQADLPYNIFPNCRQCSPAPSLIVSAQIPNPDSWAHNIHTRPPKIDFSPKIKRRTRLLKLWGLVFSLIPTVARFEIPKLTNYPCWPSFDSVR